MEIQSFFGVPAHPLFVHAPVVLTPLAVITALFMLRPSWRRPFLWATVVLTGMALGGAQLAVGSGEALEESVGESRGLEMHASLGEATRTLIAVFFFITLAVAAYDLFVERRAKASATSRSLPPFAGQLATVLTLAIIVSGALATTWVARTGHQGAKITWEELSEPR
ncbi:MAG TPA: DUF2231 domain-containing protein [Actinomycetota bacterium]|nr:DUF2231 domain-containing protein [Actinomycetota bacterium]